MSLRFTARILLTNLAPNATPGGLETRRPRPEESVWLAAAQAGLTLDQIWIVEGLPNPAFTAGWFRPQIYISKSPMIRLSRAELSAVVAYEGAHVLRRDPLRLLLVRAFACVRFLDTSDPEVG